MPQSISLLPVFPKQANPTEKNVYQQLFDTETCNVIVGGYFSVASDLRGHVCKKQMTASATADVKVFGARNEGSERPYIHQ